MGDCQKLQDFFYLQKQMNQNLSIVSPIVSVNPSVSLLPTRSGYLGLSISFNEMDNCVPIHHQIQHEFLTPHPTVSNHDANCE